MTKSQKRAIRQLTIDLALLEAFEAMGLDTGLQAARVTFDRMEAEGDDAPAEVAEVAAA